MVLSQSKQKYIETKHKTQSKKRGKRVNKSIAIVKALFVSYLVTGMILLLLAILMYKVSPPDMIIRVGIIFSYIFSAFTGGLILGKKANSKRYLWGILFGVLYFVIILAVSALLNKDVIGNMGNAVTVFFMCTMGGMLGGMVS